MKTSYWAIGFLCAMLSGIFLNAGYMMTSHMLALGSIGWFVSGAGHYIADEIRRLK
jgi:hypothetical protein